MLARDLDDGYAARTLAAARTAGAVATRPAWLIFAAMLALLGGCATAPVPELQAYASAYEQVRAGGHLMLDEISPIVAQAAAEASGGEAAAAAVQDCSPPEGIPPCFDPDLALREAGMRANEPRDIVIRRAALDVVTEYNTILLALAEGRSADGVTQRFGDLQTLVSTAAAVAGAPSAGISMLAPVAFELLGDLARRLETARANGTIRESLVASRDDVSELFSFLIEDTRVIYDLYQNHRGIELLRLSGASLDAQDAGQVDAAAALQVQAIGVEKQIRGFHDSLGAYARALAAAQAALDNLVRAAADDGASIADIATIIRDAGAVKTKAESFFGLIRSMRSPGAATPANPN